MLCLLVLCIPCSKYLDHNDVYSMNKFTIATCVHVLLWVKDWGVYMCTVVCVLCACVCVWVRETEWERVLFMHTLSCTHGVPMWILFYLLSLLTFKGVAKKQTKKSRSYYCTSAGLTKKKAREDTWAEASSSALPSHFQTIHPVLRLQSAVLLLLPISNHPSSPKEEVCRPSPVANLKPSIQS